ncbi:TMhelix containing protein [Vibrio phage 1.271.B._10N.286.54.B4]|nr:TMhelix containing protein [Vibrio phage 1.027.O._10N.286.54.B8]AUR92375.1 TMhelix containing protein [Vibrio phage 1.171.O._10N.261.52.F12]AUR94428.1 TMhelix containing protein [Vibrio phage 1.194.O._10N.286.54.B1]AUR94601.1 TMhelix containing protein [Vibrio phage 1.196.O._10N.286.54.E12]AUR95068.1 TMhelix containing protein [Vibrio phage 1.200.O._10N.286.55.E1]AUR99556.1 TMhelix containing protein [Vibrio phage 1.267.O._10N.286.54.A1]AUR99641.1 TMhelix containing protein [Vibrio phage 1
MVSDAVAVIAIVEFLVLVLFYIKASFKIGYYEQKLQNAGIKDSVKGLSLRQLMRL